MVREANGPNVTLDLVTSYPGSFSYLELETFPSKPTLRGYSFKYLKLLSGRYNEYDLVVGVGGGYLRFGTVTESLKTLLVMGPQLIAASMSKTRVVYMPQSIGPARFGTRRVLSRLLRRLDQVWVRDNRSLSEFPMASVDRASDLALLSMARQPLPFCSQSPPVLSVREHRGGVPPLARRLAGRLPEFDGFVQSAVAGNDDTQAVESLNPRTICSPEELIEEPRLARIVVAVRLHAALMAIAAGHYVVHLAYERKGFGAFEDLGLGDFVFNVHDFSVYEVEQRIAQLAGDPAAREAYDLKISNAKAAIRTSKSQVLASLDMSAANES
jgi:polysaccharide pyruvyl transferase WcaK-like protein